MFLRGPVNIGSMQMKRVAPACKMCTKRAVWRQGRLRYALCRVGVRSIYRGQVCISVWPGHAYCQGLRLPQQSSDDCHNCGSQLAVELPRCTRNERGAFLLACLLSSNPDCNLSVWPAQQVILKPCIVAGCLWNRYGRRVTRSLRCHMSYESYGK